jgi:hypothetical protein
MNNNHEWSVLEVIPSNVDWKQIPPKCINYLIEKDVDMLTRNNNFDYQGKFSHVESKVFKKYVYLSFNIL